jgi:hypothetical protein
MPLAISVLLGVVLLVGIYFGMPMLHQYLGYKNTQYSQNFSDVRFAGITNDMLKAAVVGLLGTPLNTIVNESYPVWALREELMRSRYGTNNQIRIEVLYFSCPKDIHRDYDEVTVSFGPDGNSIGTYRWVTD